MSYASGFKITAANLNGLYGNVGAIYGTGIGDIGYGQTTLSTTPNLTTSSPVAMADISNLLSLVTVCANHQGVSPNPSYGITPAQGSAATASLTLRDTMADLLTNRFAVANPQTTANVMTTSIATVWTGEVSTTFTATFPSEDAARYFFNTGGKINIRFAHPNGTTGPDTEWRYAFATDLGTISMGASNTTISGDLTPTNSGYGFYSLASYNQECLGMSGLGASAPYSNDLITFWFQAKCLNYAGVNNGNGSGIQFTITMYDTGNKFSLAAGTSVIVDLVSCSDLTGIVLPTMAVVSPLAISTYDPTAA